MTVVYQSNLEGGRFQLDAELNIYRIIIETIHNILKHGQTTQLNLKLAQQNDALKVLFNYQGMGLTNAQVNQLLREQEGMGLKSIQTRINNFGAKINYSIDKKGNAEIEINIPIHELRN
jgi:two-component system NarL family sensor kinase